MAWGKGCESSVQIRWLTCERTAVSQFEILFIISASCAVL
jgi:hypothetical protein